tara:strand:+ start:837 stop:1424 length:588 start_codon:yes stop_codon:yes gene_type:complete
MKIKIIILSLCFICNIGFSTRIKHKPLAELVNESDLIFSAKIDKVEMIHKYRKKIEVSDSSGTTPLRLHIELIEDKDFVTSISYDHFDVLTDHKSRTGPGNSNELRYYVRIEKENVIYSVEEDVPKSLVIPLWTLWHDDLGRRKNDEGQTYIFLLKKKDDVYSRVYPFFKCSLSKKSEIKELIELKKKAQQLDGE